MNFMMKERINNSTKNNSGNLKKKSEKNYDEQPSLFERMSLLYGLSDETRHSVIAILFFVVGIFLFVTPWGYGGFVGSSIYSGFTYLLGVGYFVLPSLLILLGISFVHASRPHIILTTSLGSFLFLFSILGLINIFSSNNSGGLIGRIVSFPLVALFDTYIATLFLGAFLVIALLTIFNTKINFSTLLFWRKNQGEITNEEEEETPRPSSTDLQTEIIPESTPLQATNYKLQANKKPCTVKKDFAKEDVGIDLNAILKTPYNPPPLSILENDRGKPGVGDIRMNASIIKRTLGQYGITVEMDEVSIGPSITRYALKPAEGVKLSKIMNLNSELSYALAAHPIRIEAPIPGQSLVGIEVPNSTKTCVGLRTLIGSDEFRDSPKPLLLGLGRGVSGKLYFADLAKMPHILIAGATGSGKSVTIHAIINSLLYRNSHQDLRFIMIDPKRVELTLYNKIPHLLTPVITDAKKAILALKWAGKEMERRYNILEGESVRDISSYHKNVVEENAKKQEIKNIENEKTVERMPYIVIILDELADIMQTYPRELEGAIVRLAQMSRAVGIHLILSTQRPSVNVITGLIKANIPARVALQVASQFDSRTILDSSGAEKLLGAGDMLYTSGEMSKPVRIQSAFMSETEVKAITKYLASLTDDSIPDEINLSQGSIRSEPNSLFESSFDDSESENSDDSLYEDARAIVMESGKASTSYLQRRLKLGYARAARLIDMLEERGIIGPGDGAKPRIVLGETKSEG